MWRGNLSQVASRLAANTGRSADEVIAGIKRLMPGATDDGLAAAIQRAAAETGWIAALAAKQRENVARTARAVHGATCRVVPLAEALRAAPPDEAEWEILGILISQIKAEGLTATSAKVEEIDAAVGQHLFAASANRQAGRSRRSLARTWVPVLGALTTQPWRSRRSARWCCARCAPVRPPGIAAAPAPAPRPSARDPAVAGSLLGTLEERLAEALVQAFAALVIRVSRAWFAIFHAARSGPRSQRGSRPPVLRGVTRERCSPRLQALRTGLSRRSRRYPR